MNEERTDQFRNLPALNQVLVDIDRFILQSRLSFAVVEEERREDDL